MINLIGKRIRYIGSILRLRDQSGTVKGVTKNGFLLVLFDKDPDLMKIAQCNVVIEEAHK